MTTVDAILRELRQSPKLKSYVDELAETLRKEGEARARFRASLKDDVRAEFINGEVVVQMATRDRHAQAVKNLVKLLDTHVVTRRLGAVRAEQSLAGFPRNDYLPDVAFWKSAKSKHFTGDQVIYPVPDFVCEVLSPSTAAVDRGTKFQDYEAGRVGEYWMADPEPETIEQWAMRGGRYKMIGRFAAGTIQSRVVRGFKIPVKAIFDDADTITVLKQMLAS